jgi:GT2 family glycosyltransferase
LIVSLDDSPEVVATVVTLGHSARLDRCLGSLAALETERRVAILCVVNAGTGIRAAQRMRGVTYTTTGLNLGWGGGLTFARTWHDAPYLWLVQDDLTCSPDALDALLAELEDGLAATTPTVLDEAGLVDPFSFGIHARVLPPPWRPPPDPFPLDELDVPDDMPYLPSRGMLVRTDAWDTVGGFDPRFYPVLWADVDFCTALRHAGLRFRHSARATVSHGGSASTPTAMGRFLSRRNERLFVAKWDGRLELVTEHLSDVASSPIDAGLERWMAGPLTAALAGSDVPAWLVRSTAVCAADAFLAIARTYSADAGAWEQERAEVHTALQQARRELAEQAADSEVRAARAREFEAVHERTTAELAEARAQAAAAQARALAAHERISSLRASRSWRVTRPLRWAARSVRGGPRTPE